MRAALRDRGVDSDVAAKALSEVDVDWAEVAFDVALRKVDREGGRDISSNKILKCKRFMHSRGFSQGLIEKAIKLALKECEQNA